MIGTRFYLNSKANLEDILKLKKLANLSNDFKKYDEQHKFFQFQNEAHLLAFPDEFMPEIFLQEVKKYCKNVSMKVSWCGQIFANSGPIIWQKDRLLGSSVVSYDQGSVYAKGTGFKSLLRLLELFIKSRGNINTVKKDKDLKDLYQQKAEEAQKKYLDSLITIKCQSNIIDTLKNTIKIKEETINTQQSTIEIKEKSIRILKDISGVKKENGIKNTIMNLFSNLKKFFN